MKRNVHHDNHCATSNFKSSPSVHFQIFKKSLESGSPVVCSPRLPRLAARKSLLSNRTDHLYENSVNDEALPRFTSQVLSSGRMVITISLILFAPGHFFSLQLYLILPEGLVMTQFAPTSESWSSSKNERTSFSKRSNCSISLNSPQFSTMLTCFTLAMDTVSALTG